MSYLVNLDDSLGYPMKWEVCPQCRGAGTSSAYLGAFTGEEMYELGDDFREDYMDGHYDRVCDVCVGRTTVQVVDEDKLTPEQEEELYSIAMSYHMEAMERKMGA